MYTIRPPEDLRFMGLTHDKRGIYFLFFFSFLAMPMACGSCLARDWTHITAVTGTTAMTNAGSLISGPPGNSRGWYPLFCSSSSSHVFLFSSLFLPPLRLWFWFTISVLWLIPGSEMTLVEVGGSFFMPKLDGPQEYVIEKWLYLFAKIWAL